LGRGAGRVRKSTKSKGLGTMMPPNNTHVIALCYIYHAVLTTRFRMVQPFFHSPNRSFELRFQHPPTSGRGLPCSRERIISTDRFRTERRTAVRNSNDMEERILSGGQRIEPTTGVIPTTAEAAASVGVRPPKKATPREWKRAWKIFRTIIPLLHAFDRLRPPDSSLALHCLWWKALSANDPGSPVADGGLAHDLLPPLVRAIAGRRIGRMFPRLHHANVEVRTAFLDRAVASSAAAATDAGGRVRLVSLGAGYDVRSIKFRERGAVDAAVELDLPAVVAGKARILGSRRFRRRRPGAAAAGLLPEFHTIDLNDVGAVGEVLRRLLSPKEGGPSGKGEEDGAGTSVVCHTIFVLEGVMIYLDEGVPHALLGMLSDVLRTVDCGGGGGTLCFADRLENVPGGDLDAGRAELKHNGWELTEWQPKPGLARHMGVAKLIE